MVARGATLRLVGLRLDEVARSEDHRDGDGHVTSSEHWVEVRGTLFVDDAFPEPAIPATLEPGATWQARFAVPAPPLGPPTAHLGESIVAWALEAHWDVPTAATISSRPTCRSPSTRTSCAQASASRAARAFSTACRSVTR